METFVLSAIEKEKLKMSESERNAAQMHGGPQGGPALGRGPQGGPPAGGPHGHKGPDLTGMLSKEEVIEKLFGVWNVQTGVEEIDVIDAAGRTLAQDYFAMYNQPVVRASGMDGVAVKSAAFADGMPDTSKWVLGVDYVRADTGDDFDDAYDSVIAIENVTLLPEGGIKISEDVEFKPGMNVQPCGANIKQGTQVGRAGTVLAPAHLAALVLGGYGKINVYKKPVIAFIPSGSELIPAGETLQRGQNFDSNSIMVKSMLEKMGAQVRLHPIIKDKKSEVAGALDEMIEEADVVILNAGTSKGSEDFCVMYLQEHGNMLFHGVKSVPGRPMSITIYKDKPVINMSGPAVGALNGCLWLMAPVIDRMLAHKKPMYIPTAEVTLTDELGFPPFMSVFSGLELGQDEEGNLIATPIPGRGPKARGMSAPLMADAYYMSSLGEHPHQAGEKIRVILAK